MKREYEVHTCSACMQERENQKHVYECKIIQENNEYQTEPEHVNYEEIFSENPENQMKIAKKFQSNMKILEKYKNG